MTAAITFYRTCHFFKEGPKMVEKLLIFTDFFTDLLTDFKTWSTWNEAKNGCHHWKSPSLR